MKKNKNKLLLFVKTPPPYHGAAIINKYVVDSRLIMKNFKIEIIDSHYSKSIDQIGKFSIKKVFIIIKNIFLLTDKLLFFKPNVIYFQLSHDGAFYRELIFIFLMKFFKTKIIFHLQGKGILKLASRSRLRFFLYKYTFQNEFVICLSENLTKDIRTVYQKTPFVVPNCSPDFLQNSNLFNSKTKPFRIIYMSNLIRSKGILDLLEAAKILKSAENEFIIDIIGSEADIKYYDINQFVESNGLSKNVVSHGPQFGSNKYELLVKGHIFVLPTYYKNEAFPLSIIEAMQAGLPIIATKEGGIANIIDEGITGYLVEKNAPLQIADKLEILINNPELRIAMGKAGRKKYEEKYTLEHFERNLNEVFQKVISNCHCDR